MGEVVRLTEECWACECGCERFYANGDGTLECMDCGTIAKNLKVVEADE